MENNLEENSNFIFYQPQEGRINVQVVVDSNNETLWGLQNSIAEIPQTKQTVSYHLNTNFKEEELIRDSNVKF